MSTLSLTLSAAPALALAVGMAQASERPDRRPHRDLPQRAERRLYDDPRVGAGYFFPTKTPALTPSRDLEVSTLTGAGGEALVANWAHPLPRAPTLLYFYGNGSFAAGELPVWEKIGRAVGANVMIVDYPGYGASGGTPSFSGCAHAASAALDHLLAKSTDEVPAVFILGRSAGSIFAIDAAARRAHDPRVRGVILESGVAQLTQRLAGRLPYAQLGIDEPALLADTARDFDHAAKIKQIKAPLLVLHTTNDRTVPVVHGRTLAAWAAEDQGKLARYLEFPTGDHNTIFAVNQAAYLGALGDFIARQSSVKR